MILSFEPPHLQIHALKISRAGEALIVEAFRGHRAAPPQVIAQVHCKPAPMQPTPKAEARMVAELKHVVVASGLPQLRPVTLPEREDEVLPRPIERLAEEPLFRAKAPKLESILVLHDDQRRVIPL